MYKKYLKKIIEYSRPYWKVQFFILTLWVLISSLGALTPFINRNIIDLIQNGVIISKLLSLLLLLLLIKTVVVILNFFAEYRFNYLQKEAASHFFRLTYEKLQKFPMERLLAEKSGDYISRILSDGELTGLIVSGFIPSILLNLIRLIIVIFVLVYLNSFLGAIALIFIPFYYFVFKRYSRGIVSSSQEERISYANVLGSLKEKIEGLPQVIFYKKEHFFLSKFLSDVENWLKNIKKVIFNMQMYTASYSYLSAVFPLIIFGVGSILVSLKKADLGTMIAFLLYSESLFEPLSNVSSNLGQFGQIIPPLERVLAIIENKDVALDGDMQLNELKTITINDLHVKYGEKVVLDHLNLNINFDSSVSIAIVGESGSGKTTLVRFLSGFFDSERCLINGVPITSYSKQSLRKHILLVGNTDFVFSMTVRENLLMGDNFKDEEIYTALKLCELDFGEDFLDVRVGEGGKALSNGEKERLVLARAILRRPTLLILDEALSGVDSETEERIFENIKGVIPNLIVISHRLSTILHCKEIYVLSNGKIAETGSHEELLKTSSTYRKIIEEQLLKE